MPAARRPSSAPPITIAPEDSIMDAARLMSELDVGELPVCHGHIVVGLVTDRDITLRAAAHGRAPRSMAVAEVMRWCGGDGSAEALLEETAEHDEPALHAVSHAPLRTR